jgi:hypothetical protein
MPAPVGRPLDDLRDAVRERRPGENVTGASLLGTELTAKRLQLLRDMLPALNRVAVLWSAALAGGRLAEGGGQAGLQLQEAHVLRATPAGLASLLPESRRDPVHRGVEGAAAGRHVHLAAADGDLQRRPPRPGRRGQGIQEGRGYRVDL